MLDPIDSVNTSITKAKQLTTYKYSGLLVCGDFNLPGIAWSFDGASLNQPDHISTLFVNNLADSFLTQFVTEQTFQLDENTCNNILDLVISESDDRIDEIIHLPPVTSLKKSHHVLKWDFKVHSEPLNDYRTEKRVFSKGDYVKMSEHFESIDWQKSFLGLNVNDCYDTFLNVYDDACNKYIPVKKITVKKKV